MTSFRALFEWLKAFDRPWLLALGLAPLAGWLLLRAAYRARRRRWELWHEPYQIYYKYDNTLTKYIYYLILLLSWLLLVVALAGPRWGAGAEPGVAVGRDIAIVIDFSRSMWARDMTDPTAPARWQSALAAARSLVDSCSAPGGDRAALVLFAARPTAASPLTIDYDYLREKLAELDAQHPPPEIRPDRDAPSGTRIGAALRLAVQLHDPRYRGMQDIVLITDADDPAGDGEWAAGLAAARAAGIPVHVIALGDPARDSTVERNGEVMTDHAGMPIRTRQDSEAARAIARDGRGEFLAAGTGSPDLGAWHRDTMRGPRRELAGERPTRRDRSGWFYAAAACLFLACMTARQRGE